MNESALVLTNQCQNPSSVNYKTLILFFCFIKEVNVSVILPDFRTYLLNLLSYQVMMKAIFFGQLLLIFKAIKCQDTFCSDHLKKLVEEFKTHELRCPNNNDNGLCCAAEKSSIEGTFKNFGILCGG